MNQAERLTAEISATAPFPRVERNIKQLAETGQQLWNRTAAQTSVSKQSAQVSASILLGGRGFDLTKATQQLDQLTSRKELSQADGQPGTKAETGVQSFLRSERESAILSAVEQIKKKTADDIDKFYWETLAQDWEAEKTRILKTALQPDISLTGDVTMMSNATAVSLQPEPEPVAGTIPEPRKFVDNVIQMIRDGKPYDHIVGSVATDGCRTSGSLDKLRPNVNVDGLIEEMAFEAERQAFLEDAVKLYDLAGVHSKALEILNKLLAGVIAVEPGSSGPQAGQRERVERISLALAERYSLQGHNADPQIAGTFFLLLDLMTFFSYYQRQAFHDALDTIQKLSVVPLSQRELDARVQDFKKMSLEIQRNIPEVLVACMNILYAQYRETKTTTMPSVTKFGMSPEFGNREQRLADIREKARTLITFAGMIPYRMSGEVNAKLVQLEVLMN